MLRTNPRSEGTIYWDGGAKKIAAWKEQHLPAMDSSVVLVDGLCKENWICNVLQLSTLEMEDLDDDDAHETGLPPMMAEKSKINYLLNN